MASSSYCASGQNILTPECQDFCLVNPNSCISSYKSYCGTDNNIQSSTCQNWCKTGSNRAFCDPLVINYCSSNTFDIDFCGCINLQNQQQWIDLFDQNGFAAKPECNFKQCSTNPNAYKTSSMVNTTCDVTFCFQNVDLSALSGNNEINLVSQNCRILDNSTVINTSQDLSIPINAVRNTIIGVASLTILLLVIGIFIKARKNK